MNRFRAIRYLAFFLEIILCYIIQTTPGMTLEVFGGRPVLLIPLALTFSVFESEIPAIFLGVLCGLLSDSGYSGPVGYYAIMLAVLCYIVSILMGNYIHTNLLTTMIIGALSIPAIIAGQFLLFYIAAGYGDALQYFTAHYISRIIYTFAFLPVMYGINRFLAAKTSAD